MGEAENALVILHATSVISSSIGESVMPRNREQYVYDHSKKTVLGRFYELQQKGQRAPRYKLCSIKEADYKNTKRGLIKRSDRERLNYLNTLYSKHLERLRKNTECTSSVKVYKLMDQWSKEYIGSTRSKQINELAIRHYRNAIKNHDVNNYQTSFNLSLVEYFQSNNCQSATIKLNIRTINQFYKWCYHQKMITEPIKLKSPPVMRKKVKTYTDDELRAIEDEIRLRLKNANGGLVKRRYQNYLRFFILIKNTGMRKSEVYNLKLSNINFQDKTIFITGNVKGYHEEFIPISEKLFEFLKHDIPDRKINEKYFLDNGNGNPYFKNSDSLYLVIDRLCKQIGIKRSAKGLHGFRSPYLDIQELILGVFPKI